MSTRRTLIADAIITTLATHGSRGLTHRAVDEAAGLAVGSTSYYFRSRAALLETAVTRLADLDVEAAGTLDPTDPSGALAGLMEHALTGAGRTATLARYELSLEAARRPEVRRALVAGTQRLQATIADLLSTVSSEVDATARARDLLAFLDGVLFAEATGTHGAPRSSAELRATADAILGITAAVDQRAEPRSAPTRRPE